VQVDLLPARRNEGDLALLGCRHRGSRQVLHAHEPLLREVGLDDGRATLALTDGVVVGLALLQQSLFLEGANDLLAGLLPVQPGEGPGQLRHLPLGVDGRQDRQAVAAADLEVHRVVPRGDLEGPGAELPVDHLVSHQRDLPVEQRQDQHLADETAVARILRVNRNRRVRQDRLRTRGSDGDGAVRALDRVLHVVEMAVSLSVLDLLVGDRGLASDAPVDQVLPPVDPTLAVEVFEGRFDRPRETFIEGESLALPVAGAPQIAQLPDDPAAVVGLPVPDSLDELLASQVGRGGALLLQVALHDVLRGDAGVVHSREPERAIALHPAHPDEHVLDGVVEHVPDGQRAGYVGRRYDDRVGPAVSRRLGREATLRLPVVVPAGLECARVVDLGQLGHEVRLP